MKYKIARVPYGVSSNEIINEKERKEAYVYAIFISNSINEQIKKQPQTYGMITGKIDIDPKTKFEL